MKQMPLKLQPWFEARQRFKLTHAEVQMARELGMNPKKFGSLDNARQEPWKSPPGKFIAACYHFYMCVSVLVLQSERSANQFKWAAEFGLESEEEDMAVIEYKDKLQVYEKRTQMQE